MATDSGNEQFPQPFLDGSEQGQLTGEHSWRELVDPDQPKVDPEPQEPEIANPNEGKDAETQRLDILEQRFNTLEGHHDTVTLEGANEYVVTEKPQKFTQLIRVTPELRERYPKIYGALPKNVTMVEGEYGNFMVEQLYRTGTIGIIELLEIYEHNPKRKKDVPPKTLVSKDQIRPDGVFLQRVLEARGISMKVATGSAIAEGRKRDEEAEEQLIEDYQLEELPETTTENPATEDLRGEPFLQVTITNPDLIMLTMNGREKGGHYVPPKWYN